MTRDKVYTRKCRVHASKPVGVAQSRARVGSPCLAQKRPSLKGFCLSLTEKKFEICVSATTPPRSPLHDVVKTTVVGERQRHSSGVGRMILSAVVEVQNRVGEASIEKQPHVSPQNGLLL